MMYNLRVRYTVSCCKAEILGHIQREGVEQRKRQRQIYKAKSETNTVLVKTLNKSHLKKTLMSRMELW